MGKQTVQAKSGSDSVVVPRRALVLGDGGWGTALALLLMRNGIATVLWSNRPEHSRELQRTRQNARYLPGVSLPEGLAYSADPHAACEGVDFVVSAVPTQFLRSVAQRFEEALPGNVPIVSATKGIEIESFRTPSLVLAEVLGKRSICVLTGPTHAEEVARGKPASALAASRDHALARQTQLAFTCDSFRLYTSDDPEGAEYAGALKNVIAIAAGICDGLGLGDNAKAALITRGMVEMARFGKAQGARAQTFFGLAGFGDLITTCCSKHSRNRAVGERIGRGETLEQVLASMQMVAEGVWTTQALFGPESDARALSLPIAEQVYGVLFEGKDPRAAVGELMQRAPAGEMDGLDA